MDRITKKLLQDFLQAQEMESSDEASDFELFCNYSILSNEYNKTFDAKTITVGAGADTGIDGLAIIVNGHLVEDTDEVDSLLESNGFLDVTYLFIQTKTSSSFDTKEMHGFYFGVSDFFSEEPKLARNDDIKKYSELSEYILDNASDFKDNPICKTFYITTGVVNEDQNISAVVSSSKTELESYNLFEKVEVNVIGANDLGKLYRKTKNPITSKFTFANKVTLPEIEGIDQSFYGVLPFSELRKLLIDDNGNLQSIFDDNVRDFQGVANLVNSNINETLNNRSPELFSVLNNGVTIVADSIKTSANSMTVSDYQIVNGCQTSNVLYENRNNDGIDEINIPLRLIVTSNEDIKSQITVSTNNQTAIKKEQLAAMSDFQKNLQHYYASINGEGKLYYERRAKEYNTDRNIIKRKIITIANQIKSFSSMFSKNPHMVTTYLGTLVKTMGNSGSKLFEADHQFSPYYMSGLAFYRLDSLFSSGVIDKKYKKIRFYLLMLVPLIASEDDFPPLNSQKKSERYCNPIITKLNNEEQFTELFLIAIAIVDRSGADVEDKQALKSRGMTDLILNAYNGEKV
ncbi:AIPR family protein [Colwellia sp. MB02u-10]|uniref:AIPR family protein n=1 Tax=Colwellia sp. MB02u-10 TaxID=2759828 RepID=UPI0015F4017C|nr:AIPR family protein [Colwellia sp. MB02u-10]MBA6339923.1 AIPR family protein [Colwellia sp. MB02u-10]